MRWLVAYLAGLLAVVGCGLGEAIHAGDDQATWVDLSPGLLVGVWLSDRGDRIEFTTDGEFFAEDVAYMFAGTGLATRVEPSQGRTPGSGFWRIQPPLGHPHRPRAGVGLDFDVIGHLPAAAAVDKLLARRTAGGTELHYSLGDPDLGTVVAYRRCVRRCLPVAPHRPAPGVSAAARDAQLAGVWRDQGGARLILGTDHRYRADDLQFAFVASGIPVDVGVDPQRGTLPSLGTWSTRPAAHDPTGPDTTVLLVIGQLVGRPSSRRLTLRIRTDAHGLLLVSQSSDPDVIDRRVFRRT